MSNVDRLMLTMNANGFKRSQYRLWSAHYGAGEHVCGPSTCKLTRTACDWTQFTNRPLNSSLDESTLETDSPVFTAPKAAPATVKAAAVPVDDTIPSADVAGLETEVSGLEQTIQTIESYLKAHG